MRSRGNAESRRTGTGSGAGLGVNPIPQFVGAKVDCELYDPGLGPDPDSAAVVAP